MADRGGLCFKCLKPQEGARFSPSGAFASEGPRGVPRIVTSTGLVKIMDFGLAKILQSAAAESLTASETELTQTSDLTTPGRHGWAEFATPSINFGKFISRRTEIGLDVHPWIGIRQAVSDNGDGGHENSHAIAVGGYGRWYPAPAEWTVRPYVELGVGPFYASRPVPAAGSRFNFLIEGGAGVSIPVSPTDPWSVVVGYRIVHISNAHLYRRNPGWNFNGYVLGIRRFAGGG